MVNKTIGIDLNDVLRKHAETVIHHYEKETNKSVFGTSFTLEDIVKFEEEVSFNHYIDNPIDVYYSTRDKISTETITKSPEKLYTEFLYQNYLIEIFGTTPTTYKNIGHDLNLLIDKYKEFNFKILVNDKRITIGPSCLFLSSLRPHIQEIKFVNNIKEIWDNCDIYITANKNIIKEIPLNRTVIKINNKFNEELDTLYNVDRLGDLIENKILEKL